MVIQIESEALKGNSDLLLAPGAIYGLEYLREHGHEILWNSSDLTDSQVKLLENESFRSVKDKSDAEAVITRFENTLQFQKDGEVLSQSESWTELANRILFPSRRAEVKRTTKETDIHVNINLDGSGKSDISTGLKFFDHMLDQIAKHGLIDLELSCKGDLEVDEHHTIEDTAIALGQAISKAVSTNKAGIQRYGFLLPMDEALATVAIDLSDRPYLEYNVELRREYVGDFPTEMLEHFYYTLAMNAKATLHVTANGKNDHHIIEATFKGFARALRFALTRSERTKGILPSTKGTI
jgi:imidazoleglycerol phosphate dehydratase HisB